MSKELTHVSPEGQVTMVDVSAKDVVSRTARAQGFIHLQEETLRLISSDGLKKGNVLATARIAGIQAAKQTAQLIPLCHQLPLRFVGVDFHQERDGLRIVAEARTQAQTGVEMEALTAVSIAALTIYDMCKAVDTSMRIDEVTLIDKVKVPIA